MGWELHPKNVLPKKTNKEVTEDHRSRPTRDNEEQ